MSAVLSPHASAQSDVGARLAFQKQLQGVTNKIHATNNIDEIMLEVSAVTVALRFASDTRASSPNASPALSSASTTSAPPTMRLTWKRPPSMT